jgi:hypothetical protein
MPSKLSILVVRPYSVSFVQEAQEPLHASARHIREPIGPGHERELAPIQEEHPHKIELVLLTPDEKGSPDTFPAAMR